jgi:dCMP deaminase
MSTSHRSMRQELHMVTALLWARRSTCKRNQCGAVITDSTMSEIVSFGYNGPAHSLPDDRCRGTEGNCGCLHAEDNAIARAHSRSPGQIMFVTTAPCEMCAQRIINTRTISKVYFSQAYRDSIGSELLHRGGVVLDRVPLTDNIARIICEILTDDRFTFPTCGVESLYSTLRLMA